MGTRFRRLDGASDAAVAPRWLEGAVTATLVLLPVLAATALYLPSGLFMPFRIMVVVLGGLAVAETVRRRGLTAPRTVAWTAILSASVAVFSVIARVRYPERVSMNEAAQVGFTLLLLVAVAVVAGDRRRALALVWGWAIAGAVSAVPGTWEALSGHYMPKNSPAAKFGELPHLGIAAFFDNPNLYAYACAVVLSLLPLYWVSAPRRMRPLVGVLGIISAWHLVETGGRLALLVVALVAALFMLRHRWTRVALGLGVAAIALAVVARLPLALALWNSITSALSFADPHSSAGKRWLLIQTGGWILQQTQWLGTGPGGFASWAKDYDHNPYWANGMTNPHSGMMEVASQYGIVTGALVVIALVSLAARGVVASERARGSRWSVDAVMAFTAAALAIGVPVLSLSHSSWLPQPATAAHLAVLVALAGHLEAAGRERRAHPATD